MVLKNWLLLGIIAFSTFMFGGIAALCVTGKAASRTAAYDERGDILYRKGRYAEAASCWQKSLTAESPNAEIINKIGMAYLAGNRAAEARRFYEKNCRLYPNALNLRYNLALAYFKEEKLEKSEEEISGISMVNPDFPRLHYLRGLIYEKKGDLAGAESEYIKEINLDPGDLGAWYKIKTSGAKRQNTP